VERDKSIFNRVVDAYMKHDEQRANIFASELAEIRKMEKMILHARLALEQIVLRLKTVTELGDIAVTLTPVVGVIQNIRGGMAAVSPQAEKELGEIGSLLSGIVMDAGQVAGTSLDFEMINEDSKNILNEAAVVAEQRMKQRFPDLPSLVTQPTGEESPSTI
jgi:division protein CdvB (Snf7/Vps24/ESCRT-III family)